MKSSVANNHLNPLQAAKGFQQAICAWFAAEGKDYPWRRTEDPYAILVSEMMLQQTQVATVLGRRYFEKWMERFPTPASLAVAEEAEILRLWEGLGYYNRARNLQKTARMIVEAHGGSFPQSAAELLKLPGLGRYTAGAVATFAYDAPEAIIDANIARVLARLFRFEAPIDDEAGKQQLWSWAEQLVPKRDARCYNSGLMELGQRICTPRQPDCESCPVRDFCASRNHGPERLPLKQAQKASVAVEEHVAWAQDGPRILLHQEAGQRRRGLWKLPERSEAFFTETLAPVIHRAVYTITHHRVQLRVYETGKIRPSDGEIWMPFSDIPSLPMPSPFRRVFQALLSR
jgi:A/G-specific adenine glycosylase